MFKKVDARQSLPKMEEEVLKYWTENGIFEKSISNRAGAPTYSFYDGPPFATGTPHYGHLAPQALKDVVPRYWTMRGFQVPRKWGWDCHGLPIENIAEKELGVNRKKDIESMGVEKFNEICRSKVLTYTEEWYKVVGRLGRWVDTKNAYKTMDKDYMESVWWVFKELWDKGLIYESYRIMHVCTRCETTLSQSEVSEGYMDVKDLSVTAEFKLDAGQQVGDFVTDDNTFALAWTTTPWTLPGNVALAVGKDIEYALIEKLDEGSGPIIHFILAKDLVEKHFGTEGYEVVKTFLGKDLIGKKYLPPFDAYYQDENLKDRENGWKIVHADFVTTDMGTGIAHEAPAFGDDDWVLAQAEKLPFVQHVSLDGTIKPEVKELAGLSVKPKENPQATDIEVVKYLAAKGLLFSKEKYEHSYPHCWRCDTPLIQYATSSWFVKVTDVKEKALENAKEINWSPEHVKAGRFGKWLEGARDWSISRQRFWASVMPVWKCEACPEMRVFGSVKDLEEASGEKIDDLHKHVVDKITLACGKCGGTMKRIPDVLDTWFDSGSMPYAQMHYMGEGSENEEKFEKSFPAQFIAEGIDQTRAWFYYLHILATALAGKLAFENVIVNGIVQAEDGKKMSKKLKNYPDPMLMFDKHGADTMRLYLLSSPIVAAENLNFSEKDMSEISRNVFRMLWNSYSFFVMYAQIDGWSSSEDAKPSENILDRWMLSELQMLIKEVNGYMESYDMMRATRAFAPFVDHLSNWYIRRSRKRFWKSEDDSDKNHAYQTLHTVLVTLAKLMAPFTPFIAEEIYRNLTGEESVHLADYPVAVSQKINLLEIKQSIGEVKFKEYIEELLKNLSSRDQNMLRMRFGLDDGIPHTLEEVGNHFEIDHRYVESIESKCLDKIRNSDDDTPIIKEMRVTRRLVTEGLQLRTQEKIKVRQPLARVWVKEALSDEFSTIVRDELNVKAVEVKSDLSELVRLDTEITPELKLEGQAREIIRFIQETRKEAGFEVDDRIEVGYQGFENVFGNAELKDLIAKEVLAESMKSELDENADIRKESAIDGETLTVTLKKR